MAIDNETYSYRENKIVAVLDKKLELGVALNVIGHLSVSLGAFSSEGMMGRSSILDGDGVSHIGIAKYPYIITKTRNTKLVKAIETARTVDGIFCADYPVQMLDTGHDDELTEALSDATKDSIEYLGAVFYGKTADIDRITGKFTLYR